MSGCKAHYNSLCNASISVVEQCNTTVLPIPEGSVLIAQIMSICDDMFMEECSFCGNTSGTCDTLSVYSQLCLQMPGMRQCSYWHTFCSVIPSWTLCAGTPGQIIPAMKMYFHTGFSEYILFKEWVPQNAFQYWLAIFSIVVIAIVYELLRAFRAIFEKRARAPQKRTDDQETLLDGGNGDYVPFKIGTDFTRALLRSVELALSYFLMLIAMTFNVGFFLALILGAFIGTVLFGRFQSALWSEPSVNSEGCH